MRNIRLYQYYQLDEREAVLYASVFKFATPSDRLGSFQAKKLTSLPYGEVNQIKRMAEASDYPGVFEKVFGISQRRLLLMRVKPFFMALNWLRQELEQLLERESHLMSVQDPKMVEAGVDRLKVFKEMNVLIPLSKEYGKTPEEIASWPYSTVFTLLYYEKVSGEIEKAYTELTTKTHGH